MNRIVKRAFTLVELLVVIGIIAVLVSILLPALAGARHAANTIKCAANLRSIGQAMMMYAQRYNNYLPGAPVNTGGGWTVVPTATNPNPGFPPSFTNANFPTGVNQLWDWETPLLNVIGERIPYSANADSAGFNSQARWDRVNFELNFGMFNCPENQLVTALYQPQQVFQGVIVPGVAQHPSYTVGMNFMVLHNPLPGSNKTPVVYGNSYENPPSTYWPRVTLVGKTSQKIFCADGARYVYFPNTPDQDYAWDADEGGAYADWGADSAYTHAQNRQHANGGAQNQPDERLLWARHGNGKTSFRFNAVFFDGHVETLGDLEAPTPRCGCLPGPSSRHPSFGPMCTALTISLPALSGSARHRKVP